MNKKLSVPASLIVIFMLLFSYQIAYAHTSVNVGDYTIEIGWVSEPPIVGQQNAIVVNVSTTSDEQPVEDVSSLIVSVSYGGQNKTLTLQPLGEDTPGQFVAPILPTVAGQYTVNLGGKLGDTDVKVDVEPEEVQAPDILEFPNAATSQAGAGFGLIGWLALLGAVAGLVGVGLGWAALRKTR